MGFEFHKPDDFRPESYESSNISSVYLEEALLNDRTYFKLPYSKIYYYNSSNKTVTMMEAYKIEFDFYNNDWSQIDSYVFVKDLLSLNYDYLYIKQDSSTIKIIEDIIEKNNFSDESLFIFETKFRLRNSDSSK